MTRRGLLSIAGGFLPEIPRGDPRRRVGFWRDHADPRVKIQYSQNAPTLPWPGDHVDPSWDPKEREAVLAHLATPTESSSYRGSSSCRLCGKSNGLQDHGDGVWVWPQGYEHYVKDHLVKPPQVFIDYVLSLRGKGL